jgi:glucose/mannose-6-phosphate isomerase
VIEWGPEGAEDNAVKVLARALQDTVPVIVGAGITTPVADRWKGQINRLARVPAFASELPEADHHEIAGWERARTSAASPPSSWTTRTCTRGPGRIALTREIVERHSAGTHVLTSRGQTAVERVLSLVLAATWSRLYLGVLRGIDPRAELRGAAQGGPAGLSARAARRTLTRSW